MLRKQTSEKDPADWIAFGAERLQATDSLWQHEGLTAAGIELLQEAVERYLKGYLIAKGWSLVRTHDLERLLKEAYPGEDLTDVGRNYDRLRRQAGEMVEVIRQALPQYFKTAP